MLKIKLLYNIFYKSYYFKVLFNKYIAIFIILSYNFYNKLLFNAKSFIFFYYPPKTLNKAILLLNI